MEVKSKLIILCVVMSIILQLASTNNGNIEKPADAKLSRKKRFLSAKKILSSIKGAIKTVVPFVTGVLGLGKGETQNTVQEMKKMMKTEMSEIELCRVEMLMAFLEAKLAMDGM